MTIEELEALPVVGGETQAELEALPVVGKAGDGAPAAQLVEGETQGKPAETQEELEALPVVGGETAQAAETQEELEALPVVGKAGDGAPAAQLVETKAAETQGKPAETQQRDTNWEELDERNRGNLGDKITQFGEAAKAGAKGAWDVVSSVANPVGKYLGDVMQGTGNLVQHGLVLPNGIAIGDKGEFGGNKLTPDELALRRRRNIGTIVGQKINAGIDAIFPNEPNDDPVTAKIQKVGNEIGGLVRFTLGSATGLGAAEYGPTWNADFDAYIQAGKTPSEAAMWADLGGITNAIFAMALKGIPVSRYVKKMFGWEMPADLLKAAAAKAGTLAEKEVKAKITSILAKEFFKNAVTEAGVLGTVSGAQTAATDTIQQLGTTGTVDTERLVDRTLESAGHGAATGAVLGALPAAPRISEARNGATEPIRIAQELQAAQNRARFTPEQEATLNMRIPEFVGENTDLQIQVRNQIAKKMVKEAVNGPEKGEDGKTATPLRERLDDPKEMEIEIQKAVEEVVFMGNATEVTRSVNKENLGVKAVEVAQKLTSTMPRNADQKESRIAGLIAKENHEMEAERIWAVAEYLSGKEIDETQPITKERVEEIEREMAGDAAGTVPVEQKDGSFKTVSEIEAETARDGRKVAGEKPTEEGALAESLKPKGPDHSGDWEPVEGRDNVWHTAEYPEVEIALEDAPAAEGANADGTPKKILFIDNLPDPDTLDEAGKLRLGKFLMEQQDRAAKLGISEIDVGSQERAEKYQAIVDAYKDHAVEERFKVQADVVVDVLKQSGLAKEVVATEEEFNARLAQYGERGQRLIADGQTYGFTDGENVYLNPAFFGTRRGLDTPIHEFGHLAIIATKQINRPLYDRALELIRQTDYWAEVSDAELSPDYVGLDAESLGQEALTRLIADRGQRLEATAPKGVIAELKKILVEIWRSFGNAVGIRDLTPEMVEKMSVEDIADAIRAEMMSGRKFGELPARGTEEYKTSPYTVKAEPTPSGSGEVMFSRANEIPMFRAAKEKNEEKKLVGDSVLAMAGHHRAMVKTWLDNIDPIYLPEDKIGKTSFGNASYGRTMENTTLCTRTLGVRSLTDAVSEYLGRPLTAEQSLFVAQQAMNFTDKPQCLYCYVAMDRMAKAEYYGSYITQMNSVITDLRGGMSRSATYKKFLDGRKDTPVMRGRFNMWAEIAADRSIPVITPRDVASAAARAKALERDPRLAPQLKDAEKYAQAASWAKKEEPYRAYGGEIRKWSERIIQTLNRHFGLRMYSFSEFSPAFILENMQMITDAAVRGLKVLWYTKEADAVRIFGNTGASFNMGVFAHEDPKTHEMTMDAMQGMDWNTAKELRAKYKNAGVVFVATNDRQVEWAGKQDWIDVIIPYHIVRTGAKVAEMMRWKNYKEAQEDMKDPERWREGMKKTIYPSEHNNDRATYFRLLEENGLKPRFERWVNEPWYMKLVNETRQAAKDMQGVQPIFDIQAAEASLDTLVNRGGYFERIGVTPEREKKIAEKIAGQIEKGAKPGAHVEPIMLSRARVTPEEDAAYADAVKRGDKEAAQRMVKEAAARAKKALEGPKPNQGSDNASYHNGENYTKTDVVKARGYRTGKQDGTGDWISQNAAWRLRQGWAYKPDGVSDDVLSALAAVRPERHHIGSDRHGDNVVLETMYPPDFKDWSVVRFAEQFAGNADALKQVKEALYLMYGGHTHDFKRFVGEVDKFTPTISKPDELAREEEYRSSEWYKKEVKKRFDDLLKQEREAWKNRQRIGREVGYPEYKKNEEWKYWDAEYERLRKERLTPARMSDEYNQHPYWTILGREKKEWESHQKDRFAKYKDGRLEKGLQILDQVAEGNGKRKLEDFEKEIVINGQVKSVDITYDDAGNLIPLSQRFDAGNEDLRFSRGGQAVFVGGRTRVASDAEHGEQTPGGLASARELAAVRNAPVSTLGRQRFMSLPISDLEELRRMVSGDIRPAHVARTLPGGVAGDSTGRGKVAILSDTIGVVDRTDMEREKATLKQHGFFRNEDPVWCLHQSAAAVRAERRRSDAQLARQLEALGDRRMQGKEAGGQTAERGVFADEVAKVLCAQTRQVGGRLGRLQTIGHAVQNAVQSMPGMSAANAEWSARRFLDWSYGQPNYSQAMTGKELTAEMFGKWLVMPRAVEQMAPEWANAIEGTIAADRNLSDSFRTLATRRLNGDEYLFKRLRHQLQRQTEAALIKLREEANEPIEAGSNWNNLKESVLFGLHDTFAPVYVRMDAATKTKIKAMKKAIRMAPPADRPYLRQQLDLYMGDLGHRLNRLELARTAYERGGLNESSVYYREMVRLENEATQRWGLTTEDMSFYLDQMRVVETGGRSAALGEDVQQAHAALVEMQTRLGPEKWRRMQQYGNTFYAIHERELLADPRAERMFGRAYIDYLKTQTHYVTTSRVHSQEELDAIDAERTAARARGAAGGDDVVGQMYAYGGAKGAGKMIGESDWTAKLVGSMASKKDARAATFEKVDRLQRALRRNQLVLDLREALQFADVKGVRDMARVDGADYPEGTRYGHINYVENGQKRVLVVPRQIADAFRGNVRGATWFARAARTVHNTWRSLIIDYNPAYWPMNIRRNQDSIEKNMPGMRETYIKTVLRSVCPGVGTLSDLVFQTVVRNIPASARLFGDRTVFAYIPQMERICRIIEHPSEWQQDYWAAQDAWNVGKVSEMDADWQMAKEMLRANMFVGIGAAYQGERTESFTADSLAKKGLRTIDEMNRQMASRSKLRRFGEAINILAKNKAQQEHEDILAKGIAYLADRKHYGLVRSEAESGDLVNSRVSIAQGERKGAAANAMRWMVPFYNMIEKGVVRHWKAYGSDTGHTLGADAKFFLGRASGLVLSSGLATLWMLKNSDDDEEKARQKFGKFYDYAKAYHDAYRNCSEYVRKNYNFAPVWNSGYTSIIIGGSLTDEERLLSPLVDFTVGTMAAGEGLQQQPSFGSVVLDSTVRSVVPDLQITGPLIEGLRLATVAASGENQTDLFRDAPMFDQATLDMRYDSMEDFGEFAAAVGERLWNYGGGRSVIAVDVNGVDNGRGEAPETVEIALKRIPWVSPMISRMVKVQVGSPERDGAEIVAEKKHTDSVLNKCAGRLLEKCGKEAGYHDLDPKGYERDIAEYARVYKLDEYDVARLRKKYLNGYIQRRCRETYDSLKLRRVMQEGRRQGLSESEIWVQIGER